MLECVLLGDSIAVGLKSHLPCNLEAKVGRNSHQQSMLVRNIKAKTVIISLGSNDVGDKLLEKSLLRNLRSVRRQVEANKVIWVIPYHAAAREQVRRVAAEWGDGLVDLMDYRTKDGVHPQSYKELANGVLR
jgi:lysophospholipase L1-like esterase